jgi:hypothetical protein
MQSVSVVTPGAAGTLRPVSETLQYASPPQPRSGQQVVVSCHLSPAGEIGAVNPPPPSRRGPNSVTGHAEEHLQVYFL